MRGSVVKTINDTRCSSGQVHSYKSAAVPGSVVGKCPYDLRLGPGDQSNK